MLEPVAKTIDDNNLIPDGVALLVAVSGGADSIFLLHALHRLGTQHNWKLTVLHLNHALRGAQADADAGFVGQAAGKLQLPFISETADVRKIAAEKKQSIEMAGRAARRDFFIRSARRLNAACVATGHTANDRVETFLLNLARGSSGDGLSSIPHSSAVANGVKVVRPLLDIERDDIETWLRRNKIKWRNDNDNRNPVYRRNRVRHELLPWLKTRLNPRIHETLLRVIRQTTLENEWMRTLTEEAGRKCLVEMLISGGIGNRPPALDIQRLSIHHAAMRRRIIKTWLQLLAIPAARINAATIEKLDCMLTDGRPPAVNLPGGASVRISANHMGYYPAVPMTGTAGKTEWPLPPEPAGTIDLVELGLRITITRTTGPINRQGGRTPGQYPAEAVIRLPQPGEKPLILRCRRPGDRLRPTSCRGTRKVQDILTDAKVPRERRDLIPLLVSGDTVVWLPGYRVNENWRAGPAREPHLLIRMETIVTGQKIAQSMFNAG